MKNRLTLQSLPIICLLMTSLSTTLCYADWSGKQKSQNAYNYGYGDFPPSDIDQQLFKDLKSKTEVEESKPVSENTTDPKQGYAAQNDQRYREHLRKRKHAQTGAQRPQTGVQRHSAQRPGAQRYNRGMNFSGPWDNNRSGFSGPWGNRGNNRVSGFNGPWDNSRSGFSGPWNNNRSGFSGPWNNNGSSFNMPWGNNNGSGFRPWGNGSSWSW